jgi:hypothetical protein
MEITEVVMQEDGSYKVNDSISVPDNMGNRHRVMVQEWIDAGNTPTAYVAPEKSWVDKRTANMTDGGYGTVTEQLEMIGEQGMDTYQTHIASIKAAHPKP